MTKMDWKTNSGGCWKRKANWKRAAGWFDSMINCTQHSEGCSLSLPHKNGFYDGQKFWSVTIYNNNNNKEDIKGIQKKVYKKNWITHGDRHVLQYGVSLIVVHVKLKYIFMLCKGKPIPLQAWTVPEGSRRLRLPHFKTVGTWRW
jgi:hypothetical protein